MLTILPSSSTRAILLTSLAIYSCIPLKAIQYYIIIDWLIHLSAFSVLKAMYFGTGCNTLILQLIPGDLSSACHHRQFHTLPVILHSQAALSNSYSNACEVAVGERIAYWIRTPQVPGSRPGWYGTFYWASDCWPQWQHQVERSLVCVEGRGRISRSGLTQDINVGSCVFQCDVPHQWIAQRQVGPVSVYCDGVRCRVLCLRHGISVWQHIGQSTIATSRHRRDMTSDVSKRRYTQTNKQSREAVCTIF